MAISKLNFTVVTSLVPPNLGCALRYLNVGGARFA
jgi:hypothetical protein